MELVYLWVEGYKNIQKQGFNFSPRFECKYENNELTIIEKKEDEYIKNFFGKNINVTAIVGKNGSGKTNILTSILDSIYSDNKNDLFKVYRIYYYNKQYFLTNTNTSIKKINNISIQKYSNNFSTYTIYFNYSLDYVKSIKNEDLNQSCSEFTNQRNIITYKPMLLQPPKSKYLIFVDKIDRDSMKRMLYHDLAYKLRIKEIKDFFIPQYFKLTIDSFLIDEINKLGYEELSNKVYNFHNKEEGLNLSDLKFIHSIQLALNIKKEINNPFSPYQFTKNFESFYNELLKKYRFDSQEYLIQIINYVKKINNNELFTNQIPHEEFDYDFFKSYKKSLFSKKKYFISENKELIEHLPSWINIELFNERELSFNSLSYGQQFLIKFIYNLLDILSSLKYDEDYRCIDLLLDEVEIGLHPEWQKIFISLLIEILKEEKDFLFNIIITSHSPFILSDLPRENIIFLKNGKQVKGIEKKQTFGANIHTLLSDSFFMEDGLMGKFAKGKINDVYNFIVHHKTNKIKTKEETQKIINIIGDPLIQRELQQLFDKKFDLSNMSLDDEINQLEAKLKALKEINK